MDKTNQIAGKFLGKKVDSSKNYDPSLLVAVPREENRKHYNIKSEDLPFEGYDIWHAYEFSTMTEKGIPTTRLIKIKYSCKNEFLIESKSLKLYLNSFNMSKFGSTIQESLEICKNIIKKDLSSLLKTDVEVFFIDNRQEKTEIFSKFVNILDFINESEININNFKEAPEVLKAEATQKEKEYYLTFDSLRSNCRVTHQPDFGDVFIYYKSSKHILENSLLEYLVSFRSENHFHEECCEMIYKRLFDILGNAELMIAALYTRRGGIDITPVRYSKNFNSKDIENILNPTVFARNGNKQ